MIPTRQDLVDADCWFDADRGGSDAMTAFKREARWRQHRWAVDELGVQRFGTHTVRRRHPDEAPEERVNGTKLRADAADAGRNFLTPAIHDVARQRLAAKQPHETLEPRRLHRDLLSSMPMAFNLFGEASLPDHEGSRARLAELFGIVPGTPSDLVFEWSPGRLDPDYTGDRTAFDVALRIGALGSPRTVVGIETKYHEHATKEPGPSPTNEASRRDHEEQTARLVAIAEASGSFAPGWQDAVLTTDLRQIWRDHLLALSMRAHPDRWTPSTRYVLVHPRRNVSFAAAAERYAALVVDDSFRAVVVEDVVAPAFAHGGDTATAFTRRYLW